MKLSRSNLRRLIKEEVSKVINESAEEMPYRARVILGLVPGVDVPMLDTVFDPFGERWAAQFMDDDPDHKTLYFALQDLSDIVAKGYENNTGQIMLKPGPFRGGERLPYLLERFAVAKSIVMSGTRSKELEKKLKSVGAQMGSSVSSKTFAVITADLESTSSKVNDAKKLEIPLFTPDTFEKKYFA